MADNNNTRRYGENRHLWRKVVGYGPTQRPVIENVVDAISEITYSINLQETLRHRDFFEVKKNLNPFLTSSFGPTFSFGYYDEGLITFTEASGTYKSFNFNFTFPGEPYVVVGVDQVDAYSNVNAFGITFSTTGAYVGISAPYNGTVHYRAIWAPSYPTLVTSSFTSSWITASAGAVTTVNNAQEYSSFFGTLPNTPNEIHQTAWNSSSNTSDIRLETFAVSDSFINSSISAPYNGLVHFIVMDV